MRTLLCVGSAPRRQDQQVERQDAVRGAGKRRQTERGRQTAWVGTLPHQVTVQLRRRRGGGGGGRRRVCGRRAGGGVGGERVAEGGGEQIGAGGEGARREWGDEGRHGRADVVRTLTER